MGAKDKLDEAGERLKQFDAALKHIDDRLAGAAEELAARVTDQTPPARVKRPHPVLQSSTGSTAAAL
jgi:hypothetical protein